MDFIFSAHSKQRRPHYKLRSEEELLKWMRFFEESIDFMDLKLNDVYQISSASSAVLFKRRTEKEVFIITFRGYKNYEKREFCNLKLENKPHDNGKLLRRNNNGTSITCGKFFKSSLGVRTLELNRSTVKKFMIPSKTKVIKFEDEKELSWLIHKDRHGRWVLNNFERR